MRLEVTISDGIFRNSISDTDSRSSEYRTAGSSYPTNSELLRRLVPGISDSRLQESRRAVGQRGWLNNMPYSIRELSAALGTLGRSRSGDEMCLAYVQAWAEKTVLALRVRTGRAAVTVGLDVPEQMSIPTLQLETPAMISYDNRLFRLRLEVMDGDTDIVSSLRNQFQTQAQQHESALRELAVSMSEEIERRVAEVERRMSRQVDIPLLSSDDIPRGLQVHHIEDGYVIYLPFHYRPKFLVAGEMRYRLNAAQAVILERRIKIAFRWDGGFWMPPLLVDNTLCTFEHYHVNCWGTLNWAEGMTSVPTSLYLLRDRMERELEIINLSNMARQNPPGLFPANDLEREEELRELPIQVVPEIGERHDQQRHWRV